MIKSRRLRWAGLVARMEEARKNGRMGKPTGKRLLGRSRCRWEGNIRMDLKEIVVDMKNWVDLEQDRDY